MLTVAEAGRRGGKARLKTMTPDARQEVARLGGQATAKSLTKAERKASAKKAVEARWSKAKRKKAAK